MSLAWIMRGFIESCEECNEMKSKTAECKCVEVTA